tara:strand:+ start:282 stop:551 length:270 start_codon:yes stop_codon:yes gene_type:complete
MTYLSRIFLNKKEGMAAMQTNLTLLGTYVDCAVMLSDCNRQVTIDFSSSSIRDFKKSMIKLDAIIQELSCLKKQLEVCQESSDFKKAFK